MQAPCLKRVPNGHGGLGRFGTEHSLRNVPQPSVTQAPEVEMWQPGPHKASAREAKKAETAPASRTATKRLRIVYPLVFGVSRRIAISE